MSKTFKLILASFLSLFLELCLIRWFPAHIFSIAFFSNVVLIASFLGLGLGFQLSEHRRNIFPYFIFILLGVLCAALLFKNIKVDLPENVQTWIWSYYQGNRIFSLNWFRIPMAILIVALIANFLARNLPRRAVFWLFGGVIASLGIAYVVPVSALPGSGFFMKALSAGLLLGVPIFFSSMLFAVLLKSYGGISRVLASNLLGAVIGGFFEYTSMVWGLNALYLFALAGYFLALVFFVKQSQ